MENNENQLTDLEEDAHMESLEEAPLDKIPEPAYFDVKLDKLTEREDGQKPRNMDRGVVICRDLKQVQAMFESNNVIKGIKPLSLQQEDKNREKEEAEVKIFQVPAEVFQDFEELDETNEELFEVVTYSLIMQFLEKICLKIKPKPEKVESPMKPIFDFSKIKFNVKASKQNLKATSKKQSKIVEDKENLQEEQPIPRWDTAIEFPDVIPSLGRSKLHELANYFGLAHHSGGSRAKGGKKRKFLIYPKTLFVEKQEREKIRLEKERADIIEKYGQGGRGMPAGEPPKNPQTFREQVMRELWEEKHSKEGSSQGSKLVTTNMLNLGGEIGKIPDTEKIKFLISEKQKDLERIKQNIVKRQERAQNQLKKLEGYKKEDQEAEEKNGGKIKKQNDDSDEEMVHQELEFKDMNEEQKENFLEENRKKSTKILKEKKQQRIYKEKLENETFKSFKDVPDEIRVIHATSVTADTINIEWEAPEDNNSKIVSYNVYMSNVKTQGTNFKKIASNVAQREYTISNLVSNYVYYIIVTASNENGEGYLSKVPCFTRTQASNFKNTGQLYVWGSNACSELGLSEELVEQNSEFYHRSEDSVFLSKPVVQTSFQNIVSSISCGNVSTNVVCVADSQNSMIVSMGSQAFPNEEYEDDETLNLMKKDDFDKIEDINSMPFQIEFRIPITKTVCGDAFSAILTSQGQVFTWGYNKCGVLGIDNQDIILQIRPEPKCPIKFVDLKNKQKKINIVDIACGFNSMIARSDDQEIFVWGRRQGIYPQVELTLAAVEKNGKIFNHAEIHQSSPRLIKNNLIFHNIVKIFAGHSNHALLTDKGEILIQGMNDYNQLCLPKEVSEHLGFFPEYRKIDHLNQYYVKDVAIGSCTIHAVCQHKETGETKLFGWGANLFGQLSNQNEDLIYNEPVDLTCEFNQNVNDVCAVSSGAFHTLVLTQSNKLFGLGKSNVGQLCQVQDEFVKAVEIPIELNDQDEIKSIHCGALYSTALVGPKEQAQT